MADRTNRKSGSQAQEERITGQREPDHRNGKSGSQDREKRITGAGRADHVSVARWFCEALACGTVAEELKSRITTERVQDHTGRIASLEIKSRNRITGTGRADHRTERRGSQEQEERITCRLHVGSAKRWPVAQWLKS